MTAFKTPLKQQSSFSANMDKVSVFDTPKTLSRATSRDVSPPTRPQPAAKVPSRNLSLKTKSSEADLEKGLFLSATHDLDVASPLWEPSRGYSVDGRPKECQMWPSRQTLKSKARQEKCHRRRKNCFGLSKRWGEMDKRKRLMIKILLGLLLVGFAVGVAIGVTRAVGGGVWRSDNRQTQLPSK